MKKPTLRQSQIKKMQICGLCYWAEYIKGYVVPPTAKMTIGTAVDDVLSHSLKQKMTTGLDISLQEAADRVSGKMDELQKETDWEDEDFGVCKDHAVESVKIAVGVIAPKIQPVLVQHNFVLECPDLPFDISGTIDCVDAENNVRDLKVSEKKNDSYYLVNRALQPASYCFAFEAIFGKKPNKFIYDRVIRPQKTQGARYEPIEGVVTETDYNHFFHCATMAFKLIDAGIYLPSHENSFLCDCERRGKLFGIKTAV